MRLPQGVWFKISILFILAFQNCSPVDFGVGQSLLCLPLDTEEVKPKLKWDWLSHLDRTNAANLPGFTQVMAAPMVGDLNHDGFPEIVFVTFSMNSSDFYSDADPVATHHRNGVLRVVDGRTGNTVYSIGDKARAPIGDTAPLLIDLDGDGFTEIIYHHYLGQNIIALNYDGSLRWSFPLSVKSYCQTGLSAIDLEGDGKAEIIVGDKVISEVAGQPVVKLTITANAADSCSSFALSLNPAKPNEAQIITRAGVFAKDGSKLFDLNIGPAVFLAAADIRPDIPGLEILATGDSQFRIFSGITGELITNVDLSIYNGLICSGRSIGGGPATIGDFDGDSATVEVAIATGQYLTIFNSHGEKIAQSRSQDCSSLETGITSFDFNGDRKPEILYGDEEYFKVYEMQNGQLKEVFKLVNPSGTLTEYPIVADIDGDGSAEIIVVSNNYAVGEFYQDPGEEQDRVEAANITGVRAFEPATKNAWMPTRKLWNQYAYNPSLVTDDLRAVASTTQEGFLSKIFRRNSQMRLFEVGCQ